MILGGEEMEFFDKRFVYLEWDNVLEGKEAFVADTLLELRRYVEGNNTTFKCTIGKGPGDYPFRTLDSDICYAFVYYDPNYECKVAYAQGKAIQIKYNDKWEDYRGDPLWSSGCEYRVRPTSKMWTACIDDKGVISVMPASEWNKTKGRQLIEGTKEKCETFVIENYCNKCPHHAACVGQKCMMDIDMWYCQGFRELKPVRDADEHVCITCIHRCPLSEPNEPCKSCWHVDGLPMWKLDKTVKVCGTCKYKDLPYSCAPCKECMEDFVDGDGERSMWEKTEAKKRRWTNRELAKWIAQGNGECMCYDIVMSCWKYVYNEADMPVEDGIRIRGWDETEWHEPEVEE